MNRWGPWLVIALFLAAVLVGVVLHAELGNVQIK